MTGENSPATFVLSLDTELAWGAVHHRRPPSREREYRETRDVIWRLLDLFQRCEIQATWAVVGHLFLASCQPEDGRKHPEIIRPTYGWLAGDWFERDPCTNVRSDSFWYGPDIVEKILTCAVPQEIGGHGFSHMIVGDPGCSRECFESELEASLAAAGAWGIKLRSFVFPRNEIGHLDVLAEKGFTAFRGNLSSWHSVIPLPWKRAARFADAFIPTLAPTAKPSLEQGMWNIPASYQYLHRNGGARLLPIASRVRKAVASLRRACRDGTAFHMWFHPFNIASDTRGLMQGLETILQEVARLRAAGLLVNRTMGDLAASLLEPEPLER